jgi:hypothetical protein
MLTRRFAVALTLLVCLAGCAGNNASPTAGSAETSASPTSSAEPPSSSAPTPSSASGPSSSSPRPSTEPSAGGAAETLTGTVEAGVEPDCKLIRDNAGNHVLYFDDPLLKSQAPVGKKVTVTGHSKPGMMTTCQQGTPFIVTSVGPA